MSELSLPLEDGREHTEGVVATEVETTVDDNADDGRHEATVETGNAVRGERLAVDVSETVELAGAAGLGRLVVVRKARTGEVERVDEEEGGSTSAGTGGNVAGEPLPVAVVLLEAEEGLEVVLYKGLRQ
jgi:hypothetical protein